MKKVLFLMFMLFLIVSGTANLRAQVRIGGNGVPNKTAVLDLNISDAPEPGNLGGLLLPRIPLSNVKHKLNDTVPMNGAIVWNTNDDFYLGKGVYVWGDTVWVPIQRTLISNSTYQSVTTKPNVEIPSNSNPELGLGMIFQVPTSYLDWSNTARFIWDVRVNAKNGEAADSDDEKSDIVISGTKQEMVFIPYDNTERTYSARVKPISNNGTVLDEWSDWTVSAAGKYRGWYRLTGPTGYDIFNVDVDNYIENPTYGRGRKKMDMSNEYAVEMVAGIAGITPTYLWSIVQDGTGELKPLVDTTQSTVKLIFNEGISEKEELVKDPSRADTIILQCIVTEGSEDPYILRRTITVGNRDECSPAAGLLDAEGNRYTVSKFDSVCWMTQNLRSTWTLQGSQKQEIPEGTNKDNDPNAVVYYYPNSNSTNSPSEYGLLYTWSAANIGTTTTEATNAFPGKTSDRQGICPDGWTLPSDYDWNQLEKEIATKPELYSDESATMEPDAWNVTYEGSTEWRPATGTNEKWWGRRMKSPTKVTSTATNGVSKIDSTGFNALLVGYLGSGNGADFGSYTNFWSSSAGSATAAWRRRLNGGSSGVYRDTTNKSYLYSVRCKK
ncbi:MAG: fibrobacter succinogenes major paralogous domain-containing protein [Dysgonamonadaceae bacterium]|jgi:uncharacterized protein (TIGR02145 family)|nr:fibrobacter succinogenes major paralogous domain-containing protein [Dysgonamonadaceae bacterium]